jgi:diadenosine tetraphosphate (Ap4A) HIT family hydrolase
MPGEAAVRQDDPMGNLTADASCVFCAIVTGRSDASRVHEDEHVVAFMDIRPVTTGHLLVVPRAHAASLETLPEDLGARIFLVAHRLAGALRRSGLPCAGVNIFLADGAVAGQEVFHVHLHVLPRTTGDGFGIRAQRGKPGRLELDAEASQIRAAASAPG